MPDSQYVAFWNAVVLKLSHDALNHIVQARTEASTGHHSSVHFGWIEEDLLARSSSDCPGRKRDADLQVNE